MDIVFAILAVLATNIGTGWVVFAYTRKSLDAAHKVALSEQAPKKRAYNRKKPAATKVVQAAMTPATGLTEGAQQKLNGAYSNGHANGAAAGTFINE